MIVFFYSRYLLIQFIIFIGVGVKFFFGEYVLFYFEYGICFMFIDYFDDVGSMCYVDLVVIVNENGLMVVVLSN